MASIAETLAQRMAALPIDPPKEVMKPLQEVAPPAQAAKTFHGPPGTRLWFNGQLSDKRFSVNGIYLTSDQNEMAQLRTMIGVFEDGSATS